MKIKSGFTFIELLVVVGIILFLALLVLVSLNPAHRFSNARNSRRVSDINSILTAVHECIVDNGGEYSLCNLSIPMNKTEIGTHINNIDMTTILEPYLETIPKDPRGGTNENTGYFIRVNDYGIVSIFADNAELEYTLMLSR